MANGGVQGHHLVGALVAVAAGVYLWQHHECKKHMHKMMWHMHHRMRMMHHHGMMHHGGHHCR